MRAGLNALSTYLKSQGLLGDFILYLCIFITTFPPLPLYSTLIILSGYSFGLFEGFAISYAAALSGAVVVFLLSKTFLKSKMDKLLEKSQGFKKVIRAVEKRPKLLFLIRVSPYPYNVMNVLLASSPTLSFSCYFWCTALALPKLLIHCAVGTTIRNFAESNKARTDSDFADSPMTDEELAREASGQRMKAIAGLVGAVLCLGVFVYLLIVARRAVDDLDDSDRLPSVDSGRSRSSTQGSSSLMTAITTIPQGRTSMAEYRPVALQSYLSASGGRDSTSYNRPASSRPRALTDDFVLGDLDSESSSLPPSAIRKSFASDGVAFGSRISMSTLREGDRLPAYDVLDSKFEGADSKISGYGKGNDERHLEYATVEPQEDGHGQLFGDAVIGRLEKVARDRSDTLRK